MNGSTTSNDLADRSISAAGWMMAGTGFRAILQVAAQITFARVIGPEQFGIFLLASLVIAFSAMFSDIGMSYALIQREEVSERDVRRAFTWHVAISGGVAAVVALTAPLIAVWFGKDGIAVVLAALSIVLLVNSAGVPAMNLLRRDLNYKAIQKALLLSYLVGYVLIGVPAALLGFGVWSPVIALLAQASLNSLLLYAQKPHPVRPLFKGDDTAWFLNYSATFFTTNIVNWALMNIDRALLGRVGSTASVGLYAAPYNLLSNPTVQILNTIQSVFFSTTSRLADNYEAMRRAYLALLGTIGLFMLPVFAGVSIAAEPIVLVLYGPAWATSAQVVHALAWAMPIYLIWAIATPILWNTNQRSLEFKYQLPLVPLWIAGAWLSAHEGIVVLAWSLVAMQAARTLITTLPAARALGLASRDFFIALRPGVLVTLSVALAVYAALAILDDAFPVIRLIVAAAVGIASWLLMSRALSSSFSSELNSLIGRTLTRMPTHASRVLVRLLFPHAKK